MRSTKTNSGTTAQARAERSGIDVSVRSSFVALRTGLLSLSAMIAVLTGCQSSRTDHREVMQRHIPATFPSNYTVDDAKVLNLQRILILPVHAPHQGKATLDYLDRAFSGKLADTRLFEVLTVDRDVLRRVVGTSSFGNTTPLPEALIRFANEHCRADAIMLVEVTSLHPYRPIRLGLKSFLIDLHKLEVVWGVDEVFDAADARVAREVTRYEQRNRSNPFPVKDGLSVLRSPRRFSEFSAEMCFLSLPESRISPNL